MQDDHADTYSIGPLSLAQSELDHSQVLLPNYMLRVHDSLTVRPDWLHVTHPEEESWCRCGMRSPHTSRFGSDCGPGASAPSNSEYRIRAWPCSSQKPIPRAPSCPRIQAFIDAVSAWDEA